MTVSCAAALFRTAARTVTCWKGWIDDLTVVADANLTINDRRDGRLCPAFWDTPPIALCLSRAFYGFKGDSKLSPAGSAIKEAFSVKNGGTYPAAGSSYFVQHKSLQKTANKVILRTVHNDDGSKHIRHHICLKWGIIFDTEVPQSVEDALPHTLVALGALGPSCASKIIKTWLNGWVTSYRMHEEHLHQCLFGCDDRDSLDHYTSCHFVHSLQSFLVPGCPRDKLARWGVCAYDASILKLVCCTFSGYHAVKAEVRNMQTNRKLKWLNGTTLVLRHCSANT